MMKKITLIAASFLVLLPGIVKADEFSLYGVKMGMPKEEVNALWTFSEADGYQIPESVLLNVIPEFDHRNRLYRLNFTIPIPLLDQYPGPYVTTAFQKAFQELYSTADQVVSIRTGRGTADITLTQKPLLESYNEHVKAQMLIQLPILLRP
jgi:hypothetical protein